jgi:hypothetical protein
VGVLVLPDVVLGDAVMLGDAVIDVVEVVMTLFAADPQL